MILEKLAAGETGEIILAAYPQLRPEHIKASLEDAARLAADEIVLANQCFSLSETALEARSHDIFEGDALLVPSGNLLGNLRSVRRGAGIANANRDASQRGARGAQGSSRCSSL